MGLRSEQAGGPRGVKPDGSDRDLARPSAGATLPVPAQYLLSLESTAGNRAVAAMVQRWRSEARPGLMQRSPARSDALSYRALQRWPANLPIADGGTQDFASMADVFRYLAGIPPDKAKDAADALLLVLMPFKRKGPPYGAETEEEVKLAAGVQSQFGMTFGEWNGLLFEARSRLEPSQRLKSQTPSTSPQQGGGVRNAAEIDEVKQFLAKAGPKFNLIYNDAELDDLVDYYKSVSLAKDEFLGIVQTGCRDVKPRSAEQLKDQMYNWKKVVGPQKHPFKFQDPQHFERFKSGLKGLVGQCVLPGPIPLPATDIRIQGSSLRTPFADDVDIAVCVTKEQYRDICAGRFQDHFFKTGQPSGKEAPDKLDVLKQLSYDKMVEIAEKAKRKEDCGYMLTGAKGRKLTSAANYILMGKFDGKSKELMEPLYTLTEKMKQDFKELNIESVTVILVGGPFDLKPAMPL